MSGPVPCFRLTADCPFDMLWIIVDVGIRIGVMLIVGTTIEAAELALEGGLEFDRFSTELVLWEPVTVVLVAEVGLVFSTLIPSTGSCLHSENGASCAAGDNIIPNPDAILRMSVTWDGEAVLIEGAIPRGCSVLLLLIGFGAILMEEMSGVVNKDFE